MKKTLKAVLIAIGILFAVGISLIVLVLNWLRNPYGMEEERLGPQGSEKLSSLVLRGNAANYLLFPTYQGNTYAVHLPIPDSYFHPSNITSRVIKSYAATVTMYYPELNGQFHPSNVNLPKCNGYCGGYLRTYISAHQKSAIVQNARLIERIGKDRLGDSALYRFEDLESAFGLEEHFQIRYPVIESKAKGNKSSTNEYWIKRAEDGTVRYLFECSPYSPSPGCSVKFNLSSRPELLVQIHFGRHLMGNWPAIVQSVDKKIESWEPSRIDVTHQ